MNDRDQPLSLTIHSMPSPTESLADDAVRTKKGRLWMLIVFLMCAAPVIASYFTYYVVQPKGDPKFGELIRPTRGIPDVQALDLTSHPHRLTELRKQWLLISVDSGECNDACKQKLYYQRQILTGLGKDRDRIDWVWLVRDDRAISHELAVGLKEATVLRVDQQDLMAWFQANHSSALDQWFYLVDPMGEWMMRFPANLDPSSATLLKKSLERLLKASNSWDTAGR